MVANLFFCVVKYGMGEKKIWTGDTSRESLGRGSVINPTHGGSTERRKVEDAAAQRLDTQEPLPPTGRRSYLGSGGIVHYEINGQEVTRDEFFKNK